MFDKENLREGQAPISIMIVFRNFFIFMAFQCVFDFIVYTLMGNYYVYRGYHPLGALIFIVPLVLLATIVKSKRYYRPWKNLLVTSVYIFGFEFIGFMLGLFFNLRG